MEFDFDGSLKEWAKDKPLSILQLDPADRAVLRIAGKLVHRKCILYGCVTSFVRLTLLWQSSHLTSIIWWVERKESVVINNMNCWVYSQHHCSSKMLQLIKITESPIKAKNIGNLASIFRHTLIWLMHKIEVLPDKINRIWILAFTIPYQYR
jgi:hypothetical protein